MFAFNITGAPRVEMIDRRNPRIQHDSDAIVRVTTTTIGPRDLARYAGLIPASQTIPGAEFCGLVEEVGEDVSAVDLGDLVIGIGLDHSISGEKIVFGWGDLDGGQALYVRAPRANDTLLKVPSAAIEERALLLADTYGLGASAAGIAAQHPGDRVCVIGCDPYGASALVALKAGGFKKVIAIDTEERRLGLAMRLGATIFDGSSHDIFNEILETTGGSGPGVVILGAGIAQDQIELGIDLAKQSGLLVFTEPDLQGWPRPKIMGLEPEIDIRRSNLPPRADVAKYMLDLWGGSLDLEPLVSHVIPVNDAERGYSQLHARERGVHKILLKM